MMYSLVSVCMYSLVMLILSKICFSNYFSVTRNTVVPGSYQVNNKHQ